MSQSGNTVRSSLPVSVCQTLTSSTGIIKSGVSVKTRAVRVDVIVIPSRFLKLVFTLLYPS